MATITVKRRGLRPETRAVDPIYQEQVRIGRELMRSEMAQAEKTPPIRKNHTKCEDPADLSGLTSKASQPVQYFLRHVASSIDTLRKNCDGIPADLERQLVGLRNVLNREAEERMKQARLEVAARRREREAVEEMFQ
jgi:hypothetical protein